MYASSLHVYEPQHALQSLSKTLSAMPRVFEHFLFSRPGDHHDRVSSGRIVEAALCLEQVPRDPSGTRGLLPRCRKRAPTVLDFVQGIWIFRHAACFKSPVATRLERLHIQARSSVL